GNILRLPGIQMKHLYGYIASSPIHIFAINDIKEMNLDIIHVHSEFGIGLYARIMAKMFNIPIISTYHTTYEDYTHYINFLHIDAMEGIAKKTFYHISKFAANTTMAIITPSQKTKDLLRSYGIEKPIHVIPTGINLEKFKLHDDTLENVKKLKEKYHLTNEIVLLFVGRLAIEKDVETLLKGFALLPDNANFKFVIVGGGPNSDSLQQLAQNLNIKDKVIFTGKIPSADIATYYHLADVFASASTTETQGITFIEALSSGLCVLAKDKEVVSDLVYEGKTGFIFNDSQEFCDKLLQFGAIEDKKALVNNCLEVVNNYDLDHFYHNIINLYTNIIEEYNGLYTIDNITLKNDCVLLSVSTNTDSRKIYVSIDTYYNLLGIRKNDKILADVMEKLLIEEQAIKAYNYILRKLSIKDRCEKEVHLLIKEKFDLTDKSINKLINYLKEKNYINDERYVSEYITSKQALLQGKNKIKYNLLSKGIEPKIVNDTLDNINESNEQALAILYANKIANTIIGKSIIEKKKILTKKLYNQGYDISLIEHIVETLNYSNDVNNELLNLEKNAYKAYLKYSRKYQGQDLRNHVYRYLVLKGFKYEDIYVVIDRMEWNNEDK
ncbi:MAG: RecX family transcriptional regulator, partial [Erysipelotrichaceae bacterium]